LSISEGWAMIEREAKAYDMPLAQDEKGRELASGLVARTCYHHH
jgi:hypothetical protein